MRFIRFNAKAQHVPGRDLIIANTLSRNPLSDIAVSETKEEIKAYAEVVSGQRLECIRAATRLDKQLHMTVKYTRQGWPRYIHHVPNDLQEYYAVRGELCEVNDLLIYQDRLVIPASLMEEILIRIHD